MQWFGPADVPVDITEVDCCVDQRGPEVSILAEIDGSPARHLFLEDTRRSLNTDHSIQLLKLCLRFSPPHMVRNFIQLLIKCYNLILMQGV